MMKSCLAGKLSAANQSNKLQISAIKTAPLVGAVFLCALTCRTYPRQCRTSAEQCKFLVLLYYGGIDNELFVITNKTRKTRLWKDI
jgi:hypothetical protein